MNRYKGLLVDLDGTIYFKGKLIKDAIDFLEGLKRKAIVIRYLTNTNGTPPVKIVERLRGYGFDIQDEQFFNPTKVAKAYFEKNESLSYYVMASDDIKAEFQDGHWDEKKPDCVLLGALEEVCNYDEINKVFNFIANGSRLISTSYSPYYYAQSGERKIDTGSFTRMFEASTGVKAQLIGKPSRLFYQMVLESASLEPKECIAIGDDIDTDIVGANQFGIYSVLVQTGKYDDAYVQASDVVPNEILSSLPRARKYFQ
ncbi:MAG: HAD-IIA family hydrolase [Ardenticatenaceae bacterium]